MNIPSKYLANAVDQLNGLPGIGKRTALRLALFLYEKTELEMEDFTDSLRKMKTLTQKCKECFVLSDEELCTICTQTSRNDSIICVVEEIQDVMAIESTTVFKGKYHVLGGLISPMDGISPRDLRINELIDRIDKQNTKEIILALSPTMEGDTTAYYIYKKLKEKEVLLTVLSRGVSIGSELQFTDEISLSKSLEQRLPYQIQA